MYERKERNSESRKVLSLLGLRRGAKNGAALTVSSPASRPVPGGGWGPVLQSHPPFKKKEHGSRETWNWSRGRKGSWKRGLGVNSRVQGELRETELVEIGNRQ